MRSRARRVKHTEKEEGRAGKGRAGDGRRPAEAGMPLHPLPALVAGRAQDLRDCAVTARRNTGGGGRRMLPRSGAAALLGVAGAAGGALRVLLAGGLVLLAAELLAGGLGQGAEEVGEEGADETDGQKAAQGVLAVRVRAAAEAVPGVAEGERAAHGEHHDHEERDEAADVG